MAIDTKKYHIEIQTHGKNPYGLLRSSYRENGRVLHETKARLTGLSLDKLRAMQAALQDRTVPKEDFRILDSREYGASFVCMDVLKQTGLNKAIYSRTHEDWVRRACAMIIGRIVYAGSKLALSNCTAYSALWEICGIDSDKIDVNDCYCAMDRLYERQETIQKALARKHLHEGTLILYDITSCYMEGKYEDSEIVDFGYSRDKKRGHKQIIISLLCTKDGCPVAVEVLPGNTKDETTVIEKINEIHSKYGIENIIFVGDRGMVTQANYDKINHETTKVITALTHSKMQSLIQDGSIQISLFDENNIVEVIDDGKRYCLCKNPLNAVREAATRKALIEKTTEELGKIMRSTHKTKYTKEMRMGKVISKYKMGKFIKFSGTGDDLSYHLDQDKIDHESRLDGCYVVYTDIPKDSLSCVEAVESYKRLMQVEQAFRSMKTVHLEIQPVYHKTDDRIKCHAFICMLAYYVMWHMKQKMTPLFDSNKSGKDRKYTFDYVIENLKAIRRETVNFMSATTTIVTTPTDEQNHILNLLGVVL